MSSEAKTDASAMPFIRKLQGKFFSFHLQTLPMQYDSLDTSRMTLLYFALSAVDVLGFIDDLLFDKAWVQSVIDWIYAQQLHPVDDSPTNVKRCGFRGGTSQGVPFGAAPAVASEFPYDEAHIAMTYTALCVLRILGDDFSRVNKKAILGALKYLQRDDGSFSSTATGTECDMRFVYCACVISALLLNDFSSPHVPLHKKDGSRYSPADAERAVHIERQFSFDVERTTQFILRSQTYDGAIGMGPDTEGHGGTTFTAIASLYLMNQLHRLRDAPSLVRWCLLQQGNGFRGRPEKPEDTCYSFWIGASLKLLGFYDFTNPSGNRRFNLSCQTQRGGFGKVVGAPPDLLHSYMGTCGLSLMGEPGLLPLDVELNLTRRASCQLGLRRLLNILYASPVGSALSTVSLASVPDNGVSAYPLLDLIAQYALD